MVFSDFSSEFGCGVVGADIVSGGVMGRRVGNGKRGLATKLLGNPSNLVQGDGVDNERLWPMSFLTFVEQNRDENGDGGLERLGVRSGEVY